MDGTEGKCLKLFYTPLMHGGALRFLARLFRTFEHWLAASLATSSRSKDEQTCAHENMWRNMPFIADLRPRKYYLYRGKLETQSVDSLLTEHR